MLMVDDLTTGPHPRLMNLGSNNGSKNLTGTYQPSIQNVSFKLRKEKYYYMVKVGNIDSRKAIKKNALNMS